MSTPTRLRSVRRVLVDYGDDAVSYLLLGVIYFCSVLSPRHSQIGAEDVDAGLALFLPVVGQPGHRIYAGKAYTRLAVSELFRRVLISLRERVRLSLLSHP